MADSVPRRANFGAAVAAAEQRARNALLRNHGGGHAQVSNLELFFDLVFVFAITQVSHTLKQHFDLAGAGKALMLYMAVWWLWMYTTWGANWVNPERLQVRVVLLLTMLGSLCLAVALPHAFGDDALLFAGAYIALQIGRTLWLCWVFRSEPGGHARNFLRIALWFMASALFWVFGALRGGQEQVGWWLLALAIEYCGPFCFFRVPVLGRSSAADWDISPSHMAERCGLFIIIALGEGIVITGASVAGQDLSPGLGAAMAIAFGSAALMWWLYFDIGAERGMRRMVADNAPGRIARNAYTYLHMPIVAGIIVAAVGDALLLEHWDEATDSKLLVAQIGGAAIFLVGLGLFKREASPIGNFPLSHSAALLALAGLAAWGTLAKPGALVFSLGLDLILLAACVWEWVSFHGGWMERMEARGWPLAARLRQRVERRRASRQEQPDQT